MTSMRSWEVRPRRALLRGLSLPFRKQEAAALQMGLRRVLLVPRPGSEPTSSPEGSQLLSIPSLALLPGLLTHSEHHALGQHLGQALPHHSRLSSHFTPSALPTAASRPHLPPPQGPLSHITHYPV